MNPRQRRGVILMVLSVLVAALVFVILTGFVRNVRSQVGQMVTVYRAVDTVEAYTPLGAANLEPVEVPRRWTSQTAQVDLPALEGRRVGFRLEAGTVVTSDMLIPASGLSPTEREVAINVDAVTGVGGRLRPGDRVDVYATLSTVAGLPAQVRVLVRNVRVVSLGGLQTVTESGDDGIREAQVLPVTLALEQPDSQAVTFAARFADEVRLVGLPTDTGLDRSDEIDQFDAGDLGGVPVVEGIENTSGQLP